MSHGWGAFSRAFVPPCNLLGGRQLSDQSFAYLWRTGTLVGYCKL